MKQGDCSVAGPNQNPNEGDDSLEIHISPWDENIVDCLRLSSNKHGITIVLIRNTIDDSCTYEVFRVLIRPTVEITV